MKSLLAFLFILQAYAQTTSTQLPISPAALSGILIVLMLLVFLCVGMSALSSISGPATYSSVPLLVGKEK
jgi:hypothetical protein